VFLDWWANHTGPRQTGYQAPLVVNPTTGLREFHSGAFWPLDGAQSQVLLTSDATLCLDRRGVIFAKLHDRLA